MSYTSNLSTTLKAHVYGQRAAELLARVPPSKREAVMGLLEAMVKMLE